MPCTHLKWRFSLIRTQQVSEHQMDDAVIIVETAIASINVITDFSSVWGMLDSQKMTQQRIVPWAWMSLWLLMTAIRLCLSHLSSIRIPPTRWYLTDLYGLWVDFLAYIILVVHVGATWTQPFHLYFISQLSRFPTKLCWEWKVWVRGYYIASFPGPA